MRPDRSREDAPITSTSDAFFGELRALTMAAVYEAVDAMSAVIDTSPGTAVDRDDLRAVAVRLISGAGHSSMVMLNGGTVSAATCSLQLTDAAAQELAADFASAYLRALDDEG